MAKSNFELEYRTKKLIEIKNATISASTNKRNKRSSSSLHISNTYNNSKNNSFVRYALHCVLAFRMTSDK